LVEIKTISLVRFSSPWICQSLR